MSIIQSQRQESEYWSTEIPSSDVQLLTKKAKKNYRFIFIFSSIDYILIILIILNKSNFFDSDKNNISLLIIKLFILSIFYLFIIISLLLLNYRLATITKYIYLLFTILYYLFEICVNFISLIKNYNILDLIFFINSIKYNTKIVCFLLY